MKFTDLVFRERGKEEWGQGVEALVWFENGYGASVVRHTKSRGHSEGLYELAVVRRTSLEPGHWRIVYDTPIAEGAVGWLGEEAVGWHLALIESLSAPAEEFAASRSQEA